MHVAAEPSGTQTNVPRARQGRGGALRARLAGLAAAGGVLLGVLAFPQAALAQGQFTGVMNSGDQWVDVGGAPVNISITITAPQNPQGSSTDVQGRLEGIDDFAYVSVVDGGGCTVEGDSSVSCDNVEMNGQRTITFAVNPMPESDLPEGEQETGQFKVSFDGGEAQVGITVVGHAAVSQITSISGTVKSNGDPVDGADLKLTDGEDQEHEATSDGDGSFEFTGDSSSPISPGEMTLAITKEGFEDKEETFTVNEGSQTFTYNVTLAQVEAEESSAPATSEAASSAAAETPSEPVDEGGVSGTLIFLIVIGALLVIGGIVGIVFLLRGGKDDKDDGESFTPDGPPEHQPTAAQVGTPGVYQAAPGPGAEAPTMIHPGGLVDAGMGNPAAPTQFGPAYGGGSDSTQVMPQGGFGAAPGMPGQLGPDGTTILPVVKQPGGPGASDATQIMPQANLSQPPAAAPPSAFADPGATRPHPGPSAPNPYADPNATRPHPGASPSPYGVDPGATRPHPSPTPPPPGGGMFSPQNPGNAPGPANEAFGAPSAPQYGPGSQGHGPQGGQGGYGSHASPSAPPSGDQYPSQSMRRDPYAPPEQPAPPTGEYGGTRAMPQYGSPSQPPPAPPGSEPNREGEDPDSRRTDRRNWGEWDDRPRSW